MQTLGLATEQLQGPKAGGRTTSLIQREQRQCCSDFLPQSLVQNVLLVGAERSDEFADAMRLVCQGHKVVVVNPHASLAARSFAKDGGTFVPTTIEYLPLARILHKASRTRSLVVANSLARNDFRKLQCDGALSQPVC